MCELYTDVAGVYSADPRIVARAGRMPEISFDELLEMTASGCPKPAMRSVEFARRHGVKLHIRSAFTWEPGTIVTEEHTDMEQAVVNAVTHDTSEAKVTVSGVPDQPGIAAKMFTVLAEAGINVDMIVQNISEHGRTDISFTVPHAEAEQATELINGLHGPGRRRRLRLRPRHRPGLARRRRHEVEPRRRRQDVPGPGRQRHQHRDDLDLGHPHLAASSSSRRSSRPSSCSTPRSTSTSTLTSRHGNRRCLRPYPVWPCA